MAKQRIGPGEGLVEPESKRRDGVTESEDVEGHGLPTTAPPGIAHRSPGHGGENIPNPDDEDDVEGHKRK
jgi:hypothetical protein